MPAWASRSERMSIGGASFLAMKYIIGALALLWCFWGVCPFVVFAMSECAPDGGLADAPAGISLGYLPILGSALALEFLASKWINPVLADALGPYTLCGKELPFAVYMAMVFGISVMQHLDLYTSGLFTGRVTKAAWCPDTRFEMVWARVVQRSALRHLPSLYVMALIVWVSMGMQLFLALYHGMPLKRRSAVMTQFKGVSCALSCKDPTGLLSVPNCGQEVMVASGGTTATQTRAALQALAEGARANLLVFRYHSFHVCQQLDDRLAEVVYISEEAAKMVKDSYRVAYSLAIEGAGLLNVQASALAISKAIAVSDGARPADAIDWPTAISIMIGVVVSMYTLITAVLRMMQIFKRLWPFCQKDGVGDENNKRSYPQNYKGGALGRRRKVYYALAVLAFASCVTVLLQCYAVVKTIMAVWFCDYGVWNLSGCVQGPF